MTARCKECGWSAPRHHVLCNLNRNLRELPRTLSRTEAVEIDRKVGITPLRLCRDEGCKIPEEHEAHDKVYDVSAHLEAVAATIGERGKTRDLAKGERSMARCVRMFNAATGRDLSAREGWLFMLCLKTARMATGRYKEDDYLDHTGYSALMAEEAKREEEARQREPD